MEGNKEIYKYNKERYTEISVYFFKDKMERNMEISMYVFEDKMERNMEISMYYPFRRLDGGAEQGNLQIFTNIIRKGTWKFPCTNGKEHGNFHVPFTKSETSLVEINPSLI